MYKLNLVNSATIKERINIFSEYHTYSDELDNVSSWKKVKSLSGDKDFEVMLAMNGVTFEDFNHAIKNLDAEDVQLINDHLKNEEWYKILLELLEEYRPINSIEDQSLLDLGYIIHPFLLYFQKQLSKIIESLDRITMDKVVVSKISTAHAQIISEIFNKVVIIDLNQYLNQIDRNHNNIEFCDYVLNRFTEIQELMDFYSKYAVCTKMATIKTIYMLDFLRESFVRLDESMIKIVQTFDFNMEQYHLTDIMLSSGDSHQQGRSVIIYSFDHNKIVYKPRNLKIANAYNEFLEWINSHHNLLTMKTMKGIYEEEYAFQEFIENDECSSIDEVKEYYTRFGYTIALAYILCANDFHMENLIASGSHPVLIDLETIIQADRLIEYPDHADSPIHKKILETSVINTALLPTIAFINLDNKGIDIGALSGKSAQLPYKILAPVNINKIDMRYEFVDYVRPGASNLPKLNGEVCDFYHYRQYVIDGFQEILVFLMNNKDELLSEYSILRVFEDKKTRVIVKNTDAYATIIGYFNHPKYCEDMRSKEKLLENLWAYPHLRKEIVKYEIEDMMDNDIPIFFCNTSQLDIYSSRNQLIKDCFQETGYSKMIRMFETLDCDVIAEQLSIIKVSLGIYDELVHEMKKDRMHFLSSEGISDERLLTEARDIGRRILDDSYSNHAEDELSWLNINFSGSTWTVGPMTESLYEGKAGVAVYLLELYKMTNEKRYLDAYRKTIKSVLSKSKLNPHFSAYNGKLSVVLPILNEIRLFGHSEYSHFIKTSFEELRGELNHIEELDWINGLSGLLGLTITAYEVLQDQSYLELGKDIGNILLVKQQQFKESLNEGFAHGCIGIAYALLRLYEHTANEVFRIKALELIVLEDELIEVKGNEHKWCWGNVGVGIALLDMYRIINDEYILTKIHQIIRDYPASWKNDDSICHGNMADIELLSQYIHSNLIESHKELASSEYNKRLASVLTNKLEQKDYQINQLQELPNYTLFTGLSGIGYELLRLLGKGGNDIADVYTLRI